MPKRYGIYEAAQYDYGHSSMYRTSQTRRSPRPPRSFEREPSKLMLYFKLFIAIFTMLLGAILALCINVFDRRSVNVTKYSYKPTTRTASELTTDIFRVNYSYFFQIKHELPNKKPRLLCMNCGNREDLGKDLNFTDCRHGFVGQLFHYSNHHDRLWTIIKEEDKDEYCLKIKAKTRSVILVDCGEKNLASFPDRSWLANFHDSRSDLCIKGKISGQVKAVLCNNTKYETIRGRYLNPDI